MLEYLLTFATTSTLAVFLLTLLLMWYIMSLPSMRNMPPGPLPLPVLGNFLLFARCPDLFQLLPKMRKKYGNIFSMRLGQKDMVMLCSRAVVKEALVKQADVFSARPRGFSMYSLGYLTTSLGAGLVLSNDEKWKGLRRTSLTAMRDLGVGKTTLEEKIKEEVQVVLECIRNQNGKPYDIKELMSKCTSNIICQIIFGKRFDYHDATFVELLRALNDTFRSDIFFYPINFFPFLKFIPSIHKDADAFVKTFRKTLDYIKELIADHEPTFDPNNIRDFVDISIAMKRSSSEKRTYTDQDMLMTIVDLFLGGSDTSSHSLEWVLLYLAAYLDVQVKCQKEIDDVLGSGRMMTLADKPKLNYTEAVIQEVMRIRTAAPMAVPHVADKDTNLQGYHIPKGCLIFANLDDANLNPDDWDDSQAFRPERFLSEAGNLCRQDQVINFSAGPRSCPGENLARMEMSMFIVGILQFYTLAPPSPDKQIDLKPNFGSVNYASAQELLFIKRD